MPIRGRLRGADDRGVCTKFVDHIGDRANERVNRLARRAGRDRRHQVARVGQTDIDPVMFVQPVVRRIPRNAQPRDVHRHPAFIEVERAVAVQPVAPKHRDAGNRRQLRARLRRQIEHFAPDRLTAQHMVRRVASRLARIGTDGLVVSNSSYANANRC